MNYLIKKLAATVALFALLCPFTQARRPRPQGFRGGDGLGGPTGPGGPPVGRGIGRGGGSRPGGDFGRNETLFLNMTCAESADDQAYSCDLPREDEEGMFVCRTRYHPVTGQQNQFPICVPPGRAMEGDECGCCGEDESACPVPCGCTCELGRRREDGVVREGVYVLFDDAENEDAACVPVGVSMPLVATSTDDWAATCSDVCR
jgi:hypothetical protein